eukprot:6210010-Pleurochrysis_carterae.AAC.4
METSFCYKILNDLSCQPEGWAFWSPGANGRRGFGEGGKLSEHPVHEQCRNLDNKKSCYWYVVHAKHDELDDWSARVSKEGDWPHSEASTSVQFKSVTSCRKLPSDVHHRFLTI